MPRPHAYAILDGMMSILRNWFHDPAYLNGLAAGAFTTVILFGLVLALRLLP